MLQNGEMAEYRRSAHAVFDIKYHVVWITKYRYKVLKGGGGANEGLDSADLRGAGSGDRAWVGVA